MIKKKYIILALYLDNTIPYSRKEEIVEEAHKHFSKNKKFKFDLFVLSDKKTCIKCVYATVNLTPEINKNFREFIKKINKYDNIITDITIKRKLKLLKMKIE